MNQDTAIESSEHVLPLLGPLALVCWISSLFTPALTSNQGWMLGGELLLTGLLGAPFAIFFSPFLALAPLTNIVFLLNLVRLLPVRGGSLKSPSAGWVSVAFVFNCVALLIGSTQQPNLLGDIARFPAMWLWLLSFVLLCGAIARSEHEHTGVFNKPTKHRWRLAIVMCCALSIAGVAARALVFPSTVINRKVSEVVGIEIRRSGVPHNQLPMLDDGYLRQSKYRFFVLGGYTHESAPGGGWIVRPGATPVSHVVHEVVESYRKDAAGPGEVLRSTITIYDGTEVVARKPIYRGMIEDNSGWEGAIALKFVQSVLQPVPNQNNGSASRKNLLPTPLDLINTSEVDVAKRSLRGCPKSMALNSRDWRQLQTPQWSFNAAMNIQEVVCGKKTVLVVMGDQSGIYLDLITLDGRVVSQARASAIVPTNLYSVEEANESGTGWSVRLLGFRPGSSSNRPKVLVERLEITFESG